MLAKGGLLIHQAMMTVTPLTEALSYEITPRDHTFQPPGKKQMALIPRRLAEQHAHVHQLLLLLEDDLQRQLPPCARAGSVWPKPQP